MNNVKKFFIVYSFLLISLNAWGQEEAPDFLPQITPPSPDAAALGNYGNIPVGEFTGAVNINIPLMTYKTKNLEIPISLYYGSNGIRVDEFGSNVGLGWNINMGGIITRTIRDLDDFNFNKIYPPDDMSGGQSNPAVMDFFQRGGYINSDTEADFFTFNAGGYSGEFVFGKNGVVFTKPQKVEIEIHVDTYNELFFTMTTPNGIKYYFEETEITIFRTHGAGHQPPSFPSVTAWYLTKVKHPNGEELYLEYEEVNDFYIGSQSQTLSYSNPQSQVSCDGEVPTLYSKPPTLGLILSHHNKSYGKHLKRIFSSNLSSGEILINYNGNASDEPKTISLITHKNQQAYIIENINFSYLETNNNRYFLESIQFKDIDKRYKFEYIDPESFPERLSKAQDHWGYFNGVTTNQNLVPKGLPVGFGVNNVEYGGAIKDPIGIYAEKGILKKIIYPTQGYTEFEYESNSYWGEREIDEQSLTLQLSVTTEEDMYDEDSTAITLISDQEVAIGAFGEFNIDCGSHMNTGPNHHRTDLRVRCLDCNGGSSLVNLYYYNSYGNMQSLGTFVYFNENTTTNPVYFSGEEGKTYEIKISADFNCIRGGASITYIVTESGVVYENIPTGGIRIKSTKDFSLLTNDEIYKRYYYGKFDPENLDLIHQSSGDKGTDPHFWDKSITRKQCVGCIYKDLTDDVISSSSIIPLFNSGRSNIYYPFVTISEGGDNFENGGIAKEFILNRDYFGNSIFGPDIKGAPWTNFGWDNGLEKKVHILKKNSSNSTPIPIQVTENIYTNDERDDLENYSYAIRNNFGLLCYGDVTYTCTEQDAQNQFSYCWNVCTTDHNHLYYVGNWTCTLPDSNNEEQCLPNPCWQNAGTTLIRPNMVENLSVVEYKTISHWRYLSESKTTTYDENGENPIMTETKYFYDNPDHLQLTNQTLTNSDGKTHITEYQYPPDLIGLEQTPFMQDLTDANRISEPVITETFIKDGIITEKTAENHIKYGNNANTGNLLLPVEMHSRIGTGDININSVEDCKITYTKYAPNGNILEYKLENGTPVSIIWGYNEQYPIAKVEGENYANLSSYLSALQSASNSGSLTVASFDSLRNGLPGALVTGYVYEPLVGVKVITYPNRATEYYDYDVFGRLKEVKNSQGEVIRKMEYNYKNP